MKKTAFKLSLAVLVVLVLAVVLAPKIFIGWVVPQSAFDPSAPPIAPDYSDLDYWAALPDKDDNADIVPKGTAENDNQASAPFDVFYIHPTSYLLGGNWNAEADDFLAGLITDYGMLPQHAAVYNGVARIYAPRYRQVSQGGQDYALTVGDREQALALAYSDVQRAFDHFLDNYNDGRPFLIASHSQGTTHAVPLLQYLFSKRKADTQRFVAGYLIGNTVVENDLKEHLPVCETPTATGCYLSYNSVAEGGDGSHWQNKGAPVCVNPLSWRRDSVHVAKTKNLGSLPVTGPYFLNEPDKAQTGARCEAGILWIDVPTASGYGFALFPGGGYHAYDYNLFWMNIRVNLRERTNAFLEKTM